MIKRQLYRLLGNTLILVLILFVLDRAIGLGLERLFYKQKHGDDYVSIYLVEKANEDVLVLGSSRASHHYDCDVIGPETRMSCFNGGRDEMTITYANAVLPIVYKRYKPKVIILEVGPAELNGYTNAKVIYQRVATILLPFLHKYPAIKPTIALAGNDEIYKSLVSHIYPYNSAIGSYVQNAYTHLGHVSIKGYEPLIGHIDSATYKIPVFNNDANGVRVPELEATFSNILIGAKQAGIRLIAVVSPFYFHTDVSDNQSYNTMRTLLQQNGCEFYDFMNAPPFSQNPYLFYDETHLNDSGAKLYSKLIADVINKHPGT